MCPLVNLFYSILCAPLIIINNNRKIYIVQNYITQSMPKRLSPGISIDMREIFISVRLLVVRMNITTEYMKNLMLV